MHTTDELNLLRADIEGKLAAAADLTDDYWTVPLPERLQSGAWRIERFTLPDPLPMGVQIQNIKRVTEGNPEFCVSPGTYHRLVGPCSTDEDGNVEDGVMMSNTQLEYRTNVDFVAAAKGDVLIAGLGLGMLLAPLFAKPEVRSVTIVELSADVIAMVAPTYRAMYGSRLDIIHADATVWDAAWASHYDAIMLDIWPDISGANLPQMEAMKAHYQKFLTPGGHIECWSEPLARRQEAHIQAMIQAVRAVNEGRAARDY